MRGSYLWIYMKGLHEHAQETGDLNPRVELEIITPEISERYGNDYQGQRIGLGGVSGRLSDIPAYLGGEQVRSAYWDGDVFRVEI